MCRYSRVLYLFAFTIFLAASLLFVVQPMAGKILLPVLGGSPSVWNTCMVFFQAMLLLGYGYAHAMSVWVKPKHQPIIHLVLLAIAGAVILPFVVDVGAPVDEAGRAVNPTVWLLITLARTVGVPFLIVSTSGPLLQRWFSRTDHPAAADPYFLYGASNAGSIVGLLAYPFVIEPTLGRAEAHEVWAVCYGLLGLAIAACAVAMVRRLREEPASVGAGRTEAEGAGASIAWGTRVRWIVLAAVPSSLMIGVTQTISTDVASIPLLWIVPLLLYLLTFIVAFSKFLTGSSAGANEARTRRVFGGMAWAGIVLAMATIGLMASAYRGNIVVVIAVHVAAFFALALFCHSLMARERPGTNKLTEFYLWMSVGGVIGGIFNALVAPVVFTGQLTGIFEYPIAIAGALVLIVQYLMARAGNAGWGLGPRAVVGLVGFVLAGVGFVALLNIGAMGQNGGLAVLMSKWNIRGGVSTSRWAMALVPVVVLGCSLLLMVAPKFRRIGLVGFASLSAGFLLAIPFLDVVASSAKANLGMVPIARERTFFGLHRVVATVTYDPKADKDGLYHELTHGTTSHGLQAMEPAELRTQPLAYYGLKSGIGDVLGELKAQGKLNRVACVGMGAGTLAAYGEKGSRFDFYEIDPAVIQIASNPKYFTFLSDASARGCDVRLFEGDGRTQIANAEPGSYQAIVLDAFSSDSIPLHLVTREAVELYLSKLTPDGVLAFHVSNRYFDLTPQLAQQAGDIDRDMQIAERGKAGKTNADRLLHAFSRTSTPAQLVALGEKRSVWVIFGRDKGVLRPIVVKYPGDVKDGAWKSMDADQTVNGKRVKVWTDDHADLLSAFRAGN